jgi:hypothetical protein
MARGQAALKSGLRTPFRPRLVEKMVEDEDKWLSAHHQLRGFLHEGVWNMETDACRDDNCYRSRLTQNLCKHTDGGFVLQFGPIAVRLERRHCDAELYKPRTSVTMALLSRKVRVVAMW